MKYSLILLAWVTTALSSAYHETSPNGHVLIRPQLHRRMLTTKKGKKIRLLKGKQPSGSNPHSPSPNVKKDTKREENDTWAMGKVVGPGQIAVASQDGHSDARIVPGGPVTMQTHDPIYSKAEVHAIGPTPHGANSQTALLHPASVEGIGQSGKVKVEAPRGGYGKIKKEVNGVVTERRVRGGYDDAIEHIGSQPGEVKFTGSAARGGSAFVQVNNVQSATRQPLQALQAEQRQRQQRLQAEQPQQPQDQ